MTEQVYSSLQVRELFHIEFLRWLGRQVKPGSYAVKGGTNLRLFFKSIRYSEDMDLDVSGISVISLKDAIMLILQSRSFQGSLKTFGVDRIAPPNMSKAKQTETTQRFKIHVLTSSGENLVTKIEFSRRGFYGNVRVEPVSESVLRAYKMAPLLVPHYDIQSALIQKINALARRSVVQARDIFDIYILSSQYDPDLFKRASRGGVEFKTARENIFEIGFGRFRDTVVSYLSPDDQGLYSNPSVWDDVKLKTAHFIEELDK